jgi:hypothetical protein
VGLFRRQQLFRFAVVYYEFKLGNTSQGFIHKINSGLVMGHLADIDKSYFSHLLGAWKMAFWFILGGFRLIVHGILPNIDTKAGQDIVNHYQPPKKV